MTVFTKRAVDIFAATDAFGAMRSVINGEVQTWGAEVEVAINGAIGAGALVYATKADLDADLTHDANTGAWVVADSTDANNGIYTKSGASGSGSWTRVDDLPAGDDGWSPLFRIANDGARRVLELYDWTDGSGAKPSQTGYLGTTGIVADIAQAVDIRGPQGASGDGSGDMVFAADVIDDDTMATASANTVPTSESVKAYADTKAPLETSLTGTVAADSNPGGTFAGYAFNRWLVTDDASVGDAAATTNQGYAILIDYQVGGSSLRGTRNALSVVTTLTDPSEDAAGAGQNYVAGQFIGQAVSDDNGTDTGSGAKGAVFAINPVAQLSAGATNLLHLSCGEWNIGAPTGSSMRYKSFTNFANYPSDAVKGADVDAILWFYKQGTDAVGFDHGLLFSNEIGGTSGLQLIDTGGTIMAAKDGGTAWRGIDFSDWTFTEAAFISAGFKVDGSGNLSAGFGHFLGSGVLGGSISAVTPAAPDAIGDVLGNIAFGHQDQSTFADTPAAHIRAISGDAWSGASTPSILQVFATKTGSVTPVEQMRLLPDSVTTGKTAIWANVEGTLTQVMVGAADSGGTGKRQLVVANAA